MSAKHEYQATVAWSRGDAAFTDNKYSRAHDWRFDGGAVVRGSSSPMSVPLPYSDAAAVDPEEALVAATSSCHMLFFLHYAAKQGFVVDRYEDHAVGTMGKNADGAMALVKIALRPAVQWAGARRPTPAEVQALHDRSHHDCYIANSLRSEVSVQAV